MGDGPMKILLINSNTFKHPWPVIPFGLCCVAASVEQAGYDVHVLDLCFVSDPAAMIRKTINKLRPDVLGISVRNIDNAVGYHTQFLLESTKVHVIEPCKNVFSGPIVLGGPALGINPVEILKYFDVPFAVWGDGEEAFLRLLRNLETGLPVENAPGVVIKNPDGNIVQNPPCRVQDLNSLPLVDPSRYIDLSSYVQFNSPLQIQTKRGCALQCIYCTYNRIEGPAYRLKDPQKVAQEVEMLVEKTGIKTVEFTDSTFNIPLGHAKQVLRALITKRLNLQVRTMGLNPGAVDQELIELMKQVGFSEVDVGAESGSDKMLQALGKNFRKKDIGHCAMLLQKAKIPATWYLLLGGPGETPETLRETFETMDKVAAPWGLINVAVGMRVYNGAPIAEKLRGQFPNLVVETDNFLFPAQIPSSETLDIRTLKYLTKRHAMMRPNYFMYDEDEKTHPMVLRLVTTITKKLQFNQPVWRAFILLRKMQMWTGYSLIKRILYEAHSSVGCPNESLFQ